MLSVTVRVSTTVRANVGERLSDRAAWRTSFGQSEVIQTVVARNAGR
jgi:hypothetical protein